MNRLLNTGLVTLTATLAVVMVGYQVHLFDDAVVNATLMMILVTCTLAPWVTDRAGRKIAAAESAELPATTAAQRILVPIHAAARARPMIELALLLRDPAHRQPLYLAHSVADTAEAADGVARGEKLLADAATHAAMRADAEAPPAALALPLSRDPACRATTSMSNHLRSK